MSAANGECVSSRVVRMSAIYSPLGSTILYRACSDLVEFVESRSQITVLSVRGSFESVSLSENNTLYSGAHCR